MKILGWKVSLTNVLAVLAALGIGTRFGPERTQILTETEVRTVPRAVYRELLRGLQIDVAGLRARLEGTREVEPVVVVRTDTVVVPPDTVLGAARMTAAGDLTFQRLSRTGDFYAPELVTRTLGNCDEGWSWERGTLICDPARLGHLLLYAGARAWSDPIVDVGWWDALLGVEFQPSYRSTWRVGLQATTDQRWEFYVKRGWRLF